MTKFIYAQYPYEAKCQFPINKREMTISNYFIDSKTFIEHSNFLDDIHANLEKYNLDKELKILIVLDDMITDILSNKKLNRIVTE